MSVGCRYGMSAERDRQGQRTSKLLGLPGTLGRLDPARLVVARVEPIFGVAGEDVHVQVANVLVARGLVVLADRGPGAWGVLHLLETAPWDVWQLHLSRGASYWYDVRGALGELRD